MTKKTENEQQEEKMKFRWQFVVCMGALLMAWALAPVSSYAEDEVTVEWVFPISCDMSSPAVGADGTIYVGAATESDEGSLYAIDPDDAEKEKWVFPIDDWVYSSPAIGLDGTIYVGSYDMNLYAVNPDDGESEWVEPFSSGGTISSPAIGPDGTIYVGVTILVDEDFYMETGKACAVSPDDGSEKWTFETEGAIHSSPAIGSDGTVYVGSEDGNLYALDPADGSLKWEMPFQVEGSIYSSPAIGADSTIYVGTLTTTEDIEKGKLYAVSPEGDENWVLDLPNGIMHSTPAIGLDGTIYVGTVTSYDPTFDEVLSDGKLYAVSPDGEEKWHFLTGWSESSPIIGTGGTIYMGSEDGDIYALSPNKEERWKFPVGEADASPAIGPNGTIYVGSEEGLYAISHVSEQGVNLSWPMFRRDLSHTGRADLQIRAFIHTEERGRIEAVWKEGGRDDTEGGHRVIWGHFYASPTDVTWGSEQNPDLFVKIWFDASGRVDVNFFHVSVPEIEVFSAYEGMTEHGMTTMTNRYIRQYYENGQSHMEEQEEDGLTPLGYSPAGDPSGYATVKDLKIGAVINTVDGPSEGFWRKGGEDKTDAGHEVVWGYFYADPEKFRWASEQNPDLFVKIWFDTDGRVDVNFFHVSVPDIEVFSDLPTEGGYDQKGTTITDDRYVRHVYQR